MTVDAPKAKMAQPDEKLARSAAKDYETIIVERRERVGLITLNRPKSLNALSKQLALETLAALKAFDADDQVGAVVITGSPRAFAAGADIAEMAEMTFGSFYMSDFLAPWDEVRTISKPIIAAVSGFALGGGCELALLCDFIIASDDAQFGQPEIKLGILPGMGGSQRLTQAVGKALAMDLVLTGRSIGAAEAKAVGLVARVVPGADLLQTALEAAHTIAGYNAPACQDGQGRGQSRLRGAAFGRPAPRAALVSGRLRNRRAKGRHARLCQQARAGLPSSLKDPGR